MLHDFQLSGERVRLWQKTGESYEHILMKALAYAMFAGKYPQLEIEKAVGLRYKPDLIAQNGDARFRVLGRMRTKCDSQNTLDFKTYTHEKTRSFQNCPAMSNN